MKTDVEIKADVAAELAWDPVVHVTGIGVGVKDGVVTVTGQLAEMDRNCITVGERRGCSKTHRYFAGSKRRPRPAWSWHNKIDFTLLVSCHICNVG